MCKEFCYIFCRSNTFRSGSKGRCPSGHFQLATGGTSLRHQPSFVKWSAQFVLVFQLFFSKYFCLTLFFTFRLHYKNSYIAQVRKINLSTCSRAGVDFSVGISKYHLGMVTNAGFESSRIMRVFPCVSIFVLITQQGRISLKKILKTSWQ